MYDVKIKNSFEITKIRRNSKFKEENEFNQICKFCENSNNSNIDLYSHKIISNFFNFDYVNNILDRNPDEMILACTCLIPVHSKCLFKFIIFSQNLKCRNCNSYYILTKKNTVNKIYKIFNKKYLITNLIHLIFSIIFIILGIYFESRKFEEKFLHLKFIFLFLFLILEIISIIFHISFIKNLINLPIKEEITFQQYENKNLRKFKHCNSTVTNLLNINKTENNIINSAKLFYSFLILKFNIKINEIIEYKNEIKNLNELNRNYNEKSINVKREIEEKFENILIQHNLGSYLSNSSRSLIGREINRKRNCDNLVAEDNKLILAENININKNINSQFTFSVNNLIQENNYTILTKIKENQKKITNKIKKLDSFQCDNNNINLKLDDSINYLIEDNESLNTLKKDNTINFYRIKTNISDISSISSKNNSHTNWTNLKLFEIKSRRNLHYHMTTKSNVNYSKVIQNNNSDKIDKEYKRSNSIQNNKENENWS